MRCASADAYFGMGKPKSASPLLLVRQPNGTRQGNRHRGSISADALKD